jgi:hypothetical protein
MGIFYYVRSVALSEDLPGVEEGSFESPEEFYKIADRGYVQVCICVDLLICLKIHVLSTTYVDFSNRMLFQGTSNPGLQSSY